MKRLLLCLALCLQLPQLASGREGAEVVIQHTPVPKEPPHQGEVRVVRRGSTQVVQTLLYSKVMIRVVGAIERKESSAWPKGEDGSQDSRRYVAELRQAYQTVKQRAREKQKAEGKKERFLQLGIEFVLDKDNSYVALYLPALTRDEERLELHGQELLKKLPLSRHYVQKNMQLIVQDSFEVDAGAAASLLRQAAGGS